MASQMKPGPSLLSGAAGTARPVPHVSAPQASRLWFIDNLRVVLICGVVVAHLTLTYGAFGGGFGPYSYYRDPAQVDMLTSNVLTILIGIGASCGMGFFFLLAGYFTPGSYDRKGGASFLRDRLVRLGIPWLLYDLLLDPLVVYIAGGLHGSYWSFYGDYLLHVRTIAPGLVWFIETLLLFSILYAAWRALSRQRPFASATAWKLPSTRAICGFIFALGLVSFVVRIWWPIGWRLVAAVQPGSEPTPPVYQPLYPWVHRLSPQLVLRTLSPDGKDLVVDRSHRDRHDCCVLGDLLHDDVSLAAGYADADFLGGSTGRRCFGPWGSRSWSWACALARWPSFVSAGIGRGGWRKA